MNAELDDMVESKEKSFYDKIKPKEERVDDKNQVKPSTSRSSEAKNAKEEEEKADFEEDSDTDSEAELATGVRTKIKRKHYTNDELFYDPDADEEDAKWAAEKRSPTVTTSVKPIKSILKKPNAKTTIATTTTTASKSDAVLNCPCCMNMLTMDCQRYLSFFRLKWRNLIFISV